VAGQVSAGFQLETNVLDTFATNAAKNRPRPEAFYQHRLTGGVLSFGLMRANDGAIDGLQEFLTGFDEGVLFWVDAAKRVGQTFSNLDLATADGIKAAFAAVPKAPADEIVSRKFDR
jgi:hypothetical protein